MQTTSFQIIGLPVAPFLSLFSLSDQELLAQGAKRIIADSAPGYPCRVSLAEAEIGEAVIAVEFSHHDVNSPYRASGPIFVREKAEEMQIMINEIPESVSSRLLSVRAYDTKSMMITAEVIEGSQLKDYINQTFQEDQIDYLHIHHARQGCYSCQAIRIEA